MRFFWCLAAFFAVARRAGAHDSLPRCLASAASRNNVVERGLLGRKLLCAILALKVISSQDVRARKRGSAPAGFEKLD